MSLDPPAILQSTQKNVRARPISWEGAVRAKTITESDLKKIKAIDKVRKEQRKQTIEGDSETYKTLLLGDGENKSIFETTAKRTDILQYMLVLLSDLIDDVPSLRDELIKHPHPFKPFLPLLKQSSNPEDTIPLLTSAVLSSLVSYALTITPKGTPDLDDALPKLNTYIAELLKSTDSNLQDIACQEFSALLCSSKSRHQFWKQREETLKPLIEVLRAGLGDRDTDSTFAGGSTVASIRGDAASSFKVGGSVGLQLLYHVLLVIWQVSFEGRLVGKGLDEEYDIVPLYTKLLRVSPKEKTTRLLLSTLRNLLDANKTTLMPAAIACRLPAVLTNLKSRQLPDQDLKEDLDGLVDMLDEYTSSQTTLDEYSSEVESGHLRWSPVHRDADFWRENAKVIIELEDGKLCRKLAEIMSKDWSSDKQVLAIGCNDVAALVKECPEMRHRLEKLGLKARVMSLMQDDNEHVRWESLRAVGVGAQGKQWIMAATTVELNDTPISQNDLSRQQTATSISSNGPSSTSPRAQAGSDNDNADKTKRKRQPRNSACQSCAALKMKCIATTTPGVCERCARMNRDCIPAVPKPRKRRATDSFEPKGVPLADLIDHQSPRLDTFRSPRSYTNGDHVPLAQPDLDFDNRSFTRLFAQGLAIDERSCDYLLHGIDHSYVRLCCTRFTYMTACFPFVSVPFADAKAMVTRRPVTTAAICTVASASQPEIQSRMSEAFRHALAMRCIMEGERSIDLMVGLLIYIAWHHQYYKKQQIYQNLCLLAGMATDLGIQKIPSLGEQARGALDAESQRAFIGVYYVTTSLSLMGFSKPAPLSWCSSLDHFASSLYSTSSRELNLQPYIDLAHLLEDHAQLMAAAPPVQSAAYYDLATKSALSSLKTLKRIHPTASSITAVAAAAIHINARSLTESSSSNLPGSALMQTAVALKEYLDELLLRPPSTLHHLAVVDWTNLLEVLILTTRLSSPQFLSSISRVAGGGLGWESSALASMLQPDAVLDAVCAHMAAATDQSVRHEGLLTWLRGTCDSIKRRMQHDRNGDESYFDAVSSLDRARKSSNAGHDEGRFRAVNAEPTPAVHRAPPTWSPRTDFSFDLFAGGGLLDESFWAAYGEFGSR
ncbi:hypothetical protein AMS68_007454 [Peltaster fructicola]|uniref:Zn(2)-C6 fungal-type domain-containing protein n=1 Tax=Peltaster fructicola TaxID=286661 RepID=A0A6H0Y4H9_9PEZI|nr:hypothetical protein AMS68_007454 [Peltaster fructicola]